MKVALIQINPTVGAMDENAARIAEYTRRAENMGAEMAVFSEMVLTGYPPRDLLDKKDFIARAGRSLKELAFELDGSIPTVVGHPEPRRAEKGRPLYNSCSLIDGGKSKTLHRKWLLPSYDVFDEDRYFEPGRTVGVREIGGVKFGFSICEDIWNDKAFWPRLRYRRDPIARLVELDTQIIVNLSGSPFNRGKGKFRERMLGAAAENYGRPILYVNQVGGNDSLVFDGRSAAFDSKGKLTARAPEFAENILLVDTADMKGRKSKPFGDVESVREALVMGLRDYLHKCGFSKAVVGLSGGIDSTVTAALAADALGPENVTGVGMPSRYSSEGSKNDARDLAQRLGIRFETVPIESMHDAFLDELKKPLGDIHRTLTEENMQARIRGVILMAFSNHLNALLLTTGNKSECAMGYCTLYGDMAGGLAVISDLPKKLVYDIAKLYSREKDAIPPDSITKPPSAELRPDQKDSDSLPEYDVLDPILEAYIEENLTPAQIADKGFDPELVNDVIRSVDRAEYKRRQAAPGLRVTTKAFGEGRRLPIAQRYLYKS